jgi:signal peptidase I
MPLVNKMTLAIFGLIVLNVCVYILTKEKKIVAASFVIVAGYLILSKYNVIFNYTHSLPQPIFIAEVGNLDLKKEDYVAFRSKGLPNISDNHRIVKIIIGLPGEKVIESSGIVSINGKAVAKIFYKKAFWGDIHPVNNLIISDGCYFVLGVAKTSFDSRYKEFGLVCKQQIIGKAFPFF